MAQPVTIDGVVSEVRVHTVVSGGGNDSMVTSYEKLTFMVRTGSAAGDVAVDWDPRKRIIRQAPLRDGDRVHVQGVSRRNHVQARQIDNLTTGTSVTGTDPTRTMWIVLAAVFAVVIVVGGVVTAIVNPFGHESGGGGGGGVTTVPDVKGQDNVTASRTLIDAGFELSVQMRAGTRADFGRALRTDPAAGTQVQKRSSVVLTISCGAAIASICNP